MAKARAAQTIKIRELERELRVWRERERDFEERYQGPADIEGIGGRPAVLIYRDKNMTEVKRVIDDFPSVPALRTCPLCGDEFYDAPSIVGHLRQRHPGSGVGPPAPVGFLRARDYVRNEGAMVIFSAAVIGPYNTVLVRDRHRVDMFIYHRAGKLIRPRGDPAGEATRAKLLGLVVRAVFVPSVPHVYSTSQETEVQPVEAERKGFG